MKSFRFVFGKEQPAEEVAMPTNEAVAKKAVAAAKKADAARSTKGAEATAFVTPQAACIPIPESTVSFRAAFFVLASVSNFGRYLQILCRTPSEIRMLKSCPAVSDPCCFEILSCQTVSFWEIPSDKAQWQKDQTAKWSLP